MYCASLLERRADEGTGADTTLPVAWVVIRRALLEVCTVYCLHHNTTILILRTTDNGDTLELHTHVASDGANTLVVHGQPAAHAFAATQPSTGQQLRGWLAV